MRTTTLVLAIWIMPFTSLHAQWREKWTQPAIHDTFAMGEIVQSPATGSPVAAVAGAALAGGVGLLVGGFLAAGAVGAAGGCSGGSYDYSCIAAALVGAAVGEMIGVGLGAHRGNGRRGQQGAVLATSVLIGAAGIGLLAAAQSEQAAPFVISLTAVAQIVGAVVVEVTTGRH